MARATPLLLVALVLLAGCIELPDPQRVQVQQAVEVGGWSVHVGTVGAVPDLVGEGGPWFWRISVSLTIVNRSATDPLEVTVVPNGTGDPLPFEVTRTPGPWAGDRFSLPQGELLETTYEISAIEVEDAGPGLEDLRGLRVTSSEASEFVPFERHVPAEPVPERPGPPASMRGEIVPAGPVDVRVLDVAWHTPEDPDGRYVERLHRLGLHVETINPTDQEQRVLPFYVYATDEQGDWWELTERFRHGHIRRWWVDANTTERYDVLWVPDRAPPQAAGPTSLYASVSPQGPFTLVGTLDPERPAPVAPPGPENTTNHSPTAPTSR